MVWHLLNMLAGVVVACIVVYTLTAKAWKYTQMERFGAGLVGSGCVLTIGPIMWPGPTPFDDWGGTLLRVGCAVYFLGRLFRHHSNNRAAVKAARQHLDQRKGA